MGNGLGFLRLVDVMDAFSYRMWWKWKTGSGIWLSYVGSVSLSKSMAKVWILQVDEVMQSNSLVRISDGHCSFLFDNWIGLGALVYLYGLDAGDEL